MRQKSLTIASVAMSLALSASLARADPDILEVTYTGVVGNYSFYPDGQGIDYLGLFGSAGAALYGDQFTAKSYFNTVTGIRYTDENQDTLTMSANSSNASLSINGVAFNYAGVNSAEIADYKYLLDTYVTSGLESQISYTTSRLSLFGAGPTSNQVTSSEDFNTYNSGNYSNFRVETLVGSVSTVDEIYLNATHVTVLGINPPSNLDLAVMAQQSYNPSGGPPVDGFQLTSSIVNGGFGAQVYRSGDQIVVAFRGTDEGTTPNKSSNVLADQSFLSGSATPELERYVADASSLMISLYAQCSTCVFYTTGHSLGGAIAQIIGNETHITTVAFNAPGAGKLLGDLAPDMAGLAQIHFQVNGTDENIRTFGDLVSQQGMAIGKQFTIDSFSNSYTTLHPELAFGANHAISTIINSLKLGDALNAGVLGPALSSIDGYAAATYLSLRNYYVEGLATIGVFSAIDPPASTFYKLVEQPNSPFISSIILPYEDGIAGYKLEWLSALGWATEVGLLPGQTYNFASGVDGVAFQPLDAAGAVVPMPSQFLFDLAFSSSGSFSGILTTGYDAGLTSSAPEPETWLLIFTGLSALGGMSRRRRARLQSVIG